MNIQTNTNQEEKIAQEEKEVKKPIQTISKDQEEAEQDPNHINWKKFKEARKLEREEADKMSKRAKEKEEEANALRLAMEQLLNKQQHQQRNYNNDNENDDETEIETEDQRIDKKVQSALRVAEQKRQQENQQREHDSFPERLNKTFSDFNVVCSSENLDYLEYHYPEVAEAFRIAPEGYDKWSGVYKAVKRFVQNTDSRKDSRKADHNFNKPQSSSMSGISQSDSLNRVMNLDDARKKSNWERMQRTLKGLG